MANYNMSPTTSDENLNSTTIATEAGTDRIHLDIASGEIELLPIISEDGRENDESNHETSDTSYMGITRKESSEDDNNNIDIEEMTKVEFMETYATSTVLEIEDSRSTNIDVEKREGSSLNNWEDLGTEPRGFLMAGTVIEDEIPEEKAGSIYATKKTIAQGMLDIALLTANTSQLRIVLQSHEKSAMHTAILVLISFSIAFQVMVGLCLLYIGTLDKSKNFKVKRTANRLNNVVTMLIFMITIINVMVSSFGLDNIQYNSRESESLSILPAHTICQSPNTHEPIVEQHDNSTDSTIILTH